MNKNQRRAIRETLRMRRCRYCHATENLTIDHKVPLVQGGTSDLKNLQCLCKRCNGIKSGLSHRQYTRLKNWILTTEMEKQMRKETKQHATH